MRRAVLPLALVAAATPAAAQERELIVTAGAGVQLLPAAPGSDRTVLGPMIFARARNPGDPLPVRSPDQSPSVRLLGPDDGLSIGPVVNFQRRRPANEFAPGIPRVGLAVEPGVFVQGYVTPDIRVRGEARVGITGHSGVVGDIAADYVLRPPGGEERQVITVGPRLRFGDADHARSYFGVSPLAATISGLPAYRPRGGLQSVGAATGILHQFSDTWGLYGFAGYDRFVGDAGDSPLLRLRGTRNAFSVGGALTYTFRVRRPSWL